MERKTEEVPGLVAAGEMRSGETGAKTGAKTSRVRFTEDIWRDAEAAYFDGARAVDVSRQFGMSVHTIYQRVSRRGKKARAAPPPSAPMDTRVDDAELAAALERIIGFVFGAMAPGVRVLCAGVVRGLMVHAVVDVQTTRAGGIRKRMHHSPLLWKAARNDYEKGHFTVPEIAHNYGMHPDTVKKRAWLEGWRKTITVAPEPLRAPDDPEQVKTDENGEVVSAWAEVAHAAQLPPEGQWSTWLFQGGRGAGKTRAGAEWLTALAWASPRARFALVGPTLRDVREVMIEGASGIRNLPGYKPPKYNASRGLLSWDNQAVAYVFSAEEPERLRGPQFAAAWADEFCTWRHADTVLQNLRLGLRMGEDPRLVVTTTPKPIAAMRRLKAEPSCVTTQAATAANAEHLAPTFLSGLEELYGGTTLAEQELGGVLVEGDGVLWKAAELRRARGAPPLHFEQVVVAVDPPAGTASGADGSACGIVVAGRADGRCYVLADRSCMGLSPGGWAGVVAEAAREFGARRIIAEANQGGDMVRAVLARAEAPCAVELVRAGKSKRARAEPVYLLYEQGKVTHCGEFRLLEEELMALGASEREAGLDRADALVWALTILMPPPLLLRPGVERL